ncbi:hypothetical protein BDV34DRAFT_200531 [Aspergillus parasiticus]|uniref:Uncharacterized protein n=1 Tax=Aspergillus parasiticus TaxID=5067 RepID=A0A5N6DCM4_ASPPA|nr:hypothetical protein BDV34DRAFT_200531 [Aspergillus parasiticus]
MLDSTECLSGSKQTQTLCYLTSEDLLTYQSRGFHNCCKCKGGCESNGATFTARCHLGYQSACCTTTPPPSRGLSARGPQAARTIPAHRRLYVGMFVCICIDRERM